MLSLAEARALLRQLDGKPADAIESETVECKTWTSQGRDAQYREMREAVVCLANHRGGTILLGVADQRRTRREAIQGVGDLDPHALRRAIYDGTAPRILVEIEELIEPEGRLLLIHVPRGMPPHTTAEGVGKIRVGKECRPLTGTDLSRILFEGGERDLTAEILPGATLEDLDPDQIRGLQRIAATEGGKPGLGALPFPELLRNLELLHGDQVTLAAILLLGRTSAIARWAPQHEVVFLRFRSRTEYDVRHDLKGPLLALMDALQRVLEAHLRLTTLRGGGFSELSVPDIEWRAAREAVFNALVHRDYFLRQSVQIELHRERLEVSSPGGFIGGITPGNVLRHSPVRRNPLLAQVLQTLGMVNRAGMGVDRIYEELLRLGKGMPRYEADESHVRLTMPTRTHPGFARFVAEEIRAGAKPALDDLILLRAVTDNGTLDRWTASNHLQLREEEAAEKLVSLRGRGHLVPHGRGRGTSYRLNRKLSDLLRGDAETDPEAALDDGAVRLRVQAALAERGRLANAELRRLSGYSKIAVVRLMRSLQKEGLVVFRGRGRAAHYEPGPELPVFRKPRKG